MLAYVLQHLLLRALKGAGQRCSGALRACDACEPKDGFDAHQHGNPRDETTREAIRPRVMDRVGSAPSRTSLARAANIAAHTKSTFAVALALLLLEARAWADDLRV